MQSARVKRRVRHAVALAGALALCAVPAAHAGIALNTIDSHATYDRDGAPTFPTYDDGHNVVEWRGDLRRYSGAIPRINPAILADVGQAQVRLDRMARRVPLEAPWEAERAEHWDAQTFATWLHRNVATAGARTLFEIATEAVWAQEPADLSFLHVLFYAHSGGGFDSLIGTTGGAQPDDVLANTTRPAKPSARSRRAPINRLIPSPTAPRHDSQPPTVFRRGRADAVQMDSTRRPK